MSPCRLVAVYVHNMFRGTSRLVEFHSTLYSTSRENEDFHRHFLKFTHEYLHVTMRGQPRVSEVTLEWYRR